MGSFLSRALLMVLGYAYPAYKCYKVVEQDEPKAEQLLFWCRYWILIAFGTVCERAGDVLIPWLPLYGEAKLAFFIYLWHYKTNGTECIYNYVCRDFLKKHENAIDHNLLELRKKAGDLAVVSWQKAASFGLTRIFETLQYPSSELASLQEHRTDSGSQSEPEHQIQHPVPFAMPSGDDGESPVQDRQFSKYSGPGNSEKRDPNIRLHGKTPPSDDGKLKSGMFRAAMSRLRRRKSPH